MTVGLLSAGKLILPSTTILAAGGIIGVTGGAASFSQTSPSGTLVAAGGSIAVTGGAATFAAGGSGLKINFVPSATWTTNAPQSYKDAMASAKAILEAFGTSSNFTTNIELSYGCYAENENGPTGYLVPASNSLGGSAGGNTYAYSQIRSALQAIANPKASLVALLNSLPTGSTIGGVSGAYIPRCSQKMLGFIAQDGVTDGCVGMGSGWGSNELVGVCLHEITHAMGREPGSSPFSFSRYTAPSTWDLDGTASTACYFSLDNNTHTADYDVSNDRSDFLNGGIQDGNTGGSWQSYPSDCFDAYQAGNSIQDLTTAAKQLMGSMGF